MNEMEELEKRKRDQRRRQEMRRRRRKKVLIQRTILVVASLSLGLGLAAVGAGVSSARKKREQAIEAERQRIEEEKLEAERDQQKKEQAEYMVLGYDYDGASDLLKTIKNYEEDPEVMEALQRYADEKAACVPVDVMTVPHIFYHSLVNDPDRAFDVDALGQSAVNGWNTWMTTVPEFDKITQAMYDAGYVFVRLRDLVKETTDADGKVHYTPNDELLLPPGKKAVVLSVDDLSYYHSYEKPGFPEKLVVDKNGKVKCLYYTSDGEKHVGDYDVVPRLNTFLEEHPDGAYCGARGLIAMTGYNGVFGYRTDIDYEVKANLMWDQEEWLNKHPDFDRQKEIKQAIKVADAIKESGWEFASHTWGHLSASAKTADELAADDEKWINNVKNIVGPVDTIIFAHGNDISENQEYTHDNAKYNYYYNAGYRFYCNVDASVPYYVEIKDEYVRQGRINVDGFRIYQASKGQTTVLDNLFDAKEVYDERRPPMVMAAGE